MSTSRNPLPIDRRSLLRLMGATGLGVAAGGLTACGLGDDDDDTPAQPTGTGTDTAPAQGRDIKIGYVSPQTGALAPFGEADSFVVAAMQEHFATAGVTIAGTGHGVEIIVKDSQSDSTRAADVAAELILQDEADVVLVASTPDTTNPVADQCEANGVPCISSVAPWQPYFFGRGGTPEQAFQWTYHFFWGLEDVEAVYLDMWDSIETNKLVGAIWPNDPDGNAWGDPATGFPPVVGERGYTIIDPGHYENGTQDFSAQISRFRDEAAELLVGVPIPPDFTTFWTQAAQQGFRPKIATIGKALLFPSSIEALGDIGENLGTEVWWSPSHPYTSSLTGQSAQALADAYTADTGRQWTQPIGFVHALFEVAAAALAQASAPDDAQGIIGALAGLQLDTVVGPLDWTGGPVPNVAKTPLVGGQWRAAGDGGFDLVIVSNAQAPNIPTGGSVEPMA